MGDQDVLDVARRFEEAFNAGDWDSYSAVLTKDIVIETPVMQGRGPEDVLQNARRIKAAFPDMRTTITNGLSCGDTAVLELAVEGTHAGPLGPIPPTHRKVAFKTVLLLEMSNGKLIAFREYFDRAGLMAQLGIGAGGPAATA